ncbi:hypothetical protein C8F01DRAFT_1257406 [Mycena amicta]|nr:hypothetical protein C8F01DRAFT_1257406 [Mycena amicta]
MQAPAPGLPRRFMYLKNLPLRDSQKRLLTYYSRSTDQRVTMIVKARLCHYIQDGRKQTLFIGGTSEDCRIMYETLADLMTCEGTGISARHPWVLTGENGEYLVKVTVPGNEIVKDYNPVLPDIPLRSNGPFAKGMMIDCVFALHNLQSMEKDVDAAFKTWSSRWVLQATQVIRYPLFDPLFEIPTAPRLLMGVDAPQGENFILLDLLRGRTTSVAEEQAGY